MKLAFAKAKKPYQRVITFFTRPGPYSHVEICFDRFNGKLPLPGGVPVLEHDKGGLLCFSSAENDGGTRFKILDLNAEQWDLVDVPIKSLAAFKWCCGKLGVKYDFWGLRGFVFGEDDHNENDLWCSEAAIKCCQDQGYLTRFPTNISPNALARAVGLLKDGK